MYIQTALNGKIFPRCWLHSGLRKIYSSQLVSARNKKVTRKKWVCSCPNILDLLASKMINQLVWGTKRERDFFGEPMWNCSLFKKKKKKKKKEGKKRGHPIPQISRESNNRYSQFRALELASEGCNWTRDQTCFPWTTYRLKMMKHTWHLFNLILFQEHTKQQQVRRNNLVGSNEKVFWHFLP